MRRADNRCDFSRAQLGDIEFMEKVIIDMDIRLSLQQQALHLYPVPYSSPRYDEFRYQDRLISEKTESTDLRIGDYFKRFVDCFMKTRDYFMSLGKTPTSFLLKDLFGHDICLNREFRFHREMNDKAKTILYLAKKIHASAYTDPRIYNDLIEFSELNDAFIQKMTRDVISCGVPHQESIASKCK